MRNAAHSSFLLFTLSHVSDFKALSMSLPLVSIVIPSYKPAYFEQCLRSAIGQTYPNIEILVSDNCPTEEIREICKKFPGVIYQRSTAYKIENITSALYSGKGMYIKPLFDDDILHPFCIERMVAAAKISDDIELVFSASGVIDAENVTIRKRCPYQSHGIIPGNDLYRAIVLLYNVVGEFSSIMFKRQTLWMLGLKRAFKLGDHFFTRGLADAAFYCNIARGKSAYYLNEELSYFRYDVRIASNSVPAANPDWGFVLSDSFDLRRAGHMEGIISTPELLETQEISRREFEKGRDYFQVATSYKNYVDYIKTLAR